MTAQREGKRSPRGKSGSKPEIILSGGFFCLLFVVLIVYLIHFAAASEQEMVNNSYNSRQKILLSRNYRGTIYSGGGEVLAETVVDEDQNEKRSYPYGKVFSHIVGYHTNGRMGVEALANYYLINTHTSLDNKVANDIAGRKNPGDSVYTTLNVEMQKAADAQLGLYRGAAIVTEVSTGRILVMVSHPNFDPETISQNWDALMEDTASTVLLNRATQGLYPPGSTFKIVTALEYIHEYPEDYDQYVFQCPGYYQQGQDRVNCIYGTVHGRVNLERSFVVSCNSSFANIGMGLDWDNSFADTLDRLMFNRELPLELPYSKSSINVNGAAMGAAEKMQTSFGQGKTLVTPIHMNMITGAIANGGVLMKPYVVERVTNDAGEQVRAFSPEEYGRLMSAEEARILSDMMTAMAFSETNNTFSTADYTVAGKTGSAEYNDVKGESHAWFTGFAPAEDPEICFTVIMEGAGNGGNYAIPLTKRMLDVYFEKN